MADRSSVQPCSLEKNEVCIYSTWLYKLSLKKPMNVINLTAINKTIKRPAIVDCHCQMLRSKSITCGETSFCDLKDIDYYRFKILEKDRPNRSKYQNLRDKNIMPLLYAKTLAHDHFNCNIISLKLALKQSTVNGHEPD